MLHDSRIVNIRMSVCGHEVDAAVDCDWVLHCYDVIPEGIRSNTVPVEFYCIDMPEWDIEMIYLKATNEQHRTDSFGGLFLRTLVNYDELRKAAQRWVRRMVKNDSKK